VSQADRREQTVPGRPERLFRRAAHRGPGNPVSRIANSP